MLLSSRPPISTILWSDLLEREKVLKEDFEVEMTEIRRLKHLLSPAHSKSVNPPINPDKPIHIEPWTRHTQPGINTGIAGKLRQILFSWPKGRISAKELVVEAIKQHPTLTKRHVLNQVQWLRRSGCMSLTNKKGVWTINKHETREFLNGHRRPPGSADPPFVGPVQRD